MSSVPVLLYHHVAPDREITPEGFERQLAWLKGRGCRALSIGELLDHLSGKRPAPEGSVAITFDDGYADNWVYAFPLLSRYGMKAAVFVVTSRLGASDRPRPDSASGGAIPDTRNDERGPEGFLNWGELKAMAGSGLVEVGSHTHTHKGFDREAAYEDLEAELMRSREAIESRLGSWCGALAWPWGDFDAAWLPLLDKSGYRAAFTTRPGSNAPGRDPRLIRRFKVQSADASWLAQRLWLYRRGILAEAYGSLHGLDRSLKSALRRIAGEGPGGGP